MTPRLLIPAAAAIVAATSTMALSGDASTDAGITSVIPRFHGHVADGGSAVRTLTKGAHGAAVTVVRGSTPASAAPAATPQNETYLSAILFEGALPLPTTHTGTAAPYLANGSGYESAGYAPGLPGGGGGVYLGGGVGGGGGGDVLVPVTPTVPAVPEPATYALWGMGALVVSWALRRRAGRSAAVAFDEWFDDNGMGFLP